MTGRPSSFTQATADKICERLAKAESLRSICSDADMPCTTTVCKWLSDRPDFAAQYARAREAQADTIFDEILDIADDATNDFMERKNGDGSEAFNSEHVQRSKLRIDARKWMAGKLAPKKYGEKLDITSDGEKIGMPAITLGVQPE